MFENMIPLTATAEDGHVEVQHLSLPWGWICSRRPDDTWNKIHVVSALVPEECMRYEALPDLDLRLAEQVWYNQHVGVQKPGPMTDTVKHFDWDEFRYSRHQEEQNYVRQCREEVKISQNQTDEECGAKCGQHKYDGVALYPNRFFVNITR